MQPIQIYEIPTEIKDFVGTIKSITFPRQGYTSNVGVIECKNGFFVLKRTKGMPNNTSLNREVSVLNHLAATNLPIPTVHQFVEQETNNQSWALFELIEGETVRTALSNEVAEEKRQEIIFNFGKILAQVHSTPCPSELIYEKSWLDEMLAQADINLKTSTVDGDAELLQHIKVIKPAEIKQVLIHGDFTIDNVIVNHGKVAGIIDWGGGSYGDPRYDVSLAVRPKPKAFETENDKELFFKGYGARIMNEWDYNYFVKGLYEFF
ncbi:phosphotransferase family protein [Alkalicoccus daliensis]|uniref:Phosphotransferase enzyme family protein n=1 Tax=Alkalicoccus daliensis TaxID=745820 RepID=A0A1H0JY26_9BACI|nr:aminoglycoside phosphotransferase family protein [Alkalicoccus daliensis]SDO48530.1 Phosphotransferase enzyme family protein [Alkalicoccus daliensis]